MWTIIKIDKKKINFLKSDLAKKIGNDFKVYVPKLRIQKFKQNKLTSKEIDLLGDYIFCFHKKFSCKLTIESLKFMRGLKYFLDGFKDSQDDIEKFIKRCSELEDKKGFISNDLFDLEINKNYKFSSGPFTDKIFQLINIQKNRIRILIGNFSTSINSKDYLFTPL